jgi:hypothetical protein
MTEPLMVAFWGNLLNQTTTNQNVPSVLFAFFNENKGIN